MHRAYHPPQRDPRRQPPGLGWRRALAAAAGVLALLYLSTAVYSVPANQRVIVRRFGRVLTDIQAPGLHLGLPYGLDRRSQIKMSELKRVAVGMDLTQQELGRSGEPQLAECLTGDRNLICISAVVQYCVSDAPAYLFHAANVPALVEDSASAALTTIIAGMAVDDVFTSQRVLVQDGVRKAAQAALNSYGAGVLIMSVTLDSVLPPRDEGVRRAFSDVTAAREDQQRAINDAEGYRNQLEPQTAGEVQRIAAEAQGYAGALAKQSQGDVERFQQMAAQLAGCRDLALRRLILETLEEVLPRLKKIVVDPRGGRQVDLGLFEDEP